MYMCTILAYLRDSLTYMRQVAIHMMDYVDAATTNILSPDILPLKDLRKMLRHMESELPSTMHLPISWDDTLHFYQYLNTLVLIAEGQFLLLINVPIQNRVQQLQIYKVFSLPVPHSRLSAQYKINHKYIGVIYDKTKAVAIMNQQYIAWQHANRQFCRINVPFNPLRNPPIIMYNIPICKNDQAIKEQCYLSIPHVPHAFVPVAVASNLWIIPSNPETLGSAIIIIWSDKVTSIVPFSNPFTYLGYPLSAVLHLDILPTPCDNDHTIMMNVSLDTSSIKQLTF